MTTFNVVIVQDSRTVNRVLMHSNHGLISQVEFFYQKIKELVCTNDLGDVIEGQVRFGDLLIVESHRYHCTSSLNSTSIVIR